MSTFVELPEGDLVGFLDLAKALARAENPVTQAGASDMECVTGKVAYVRVPNPKLCAVPREDSLPHQQRGDRAECLAPDLSPVTLGPCASPALSVESDDESEAATITLRLPFNLTAKERQQLQKLLPNLPRLIYPIPEERRTEFLQAFRKSVGGRWGWEPRFLTEADVRSQQDKQDSLYEEFQRALTAEFEAGRLIVCSASRVPAEDVSRGIRLNYFVPRQSALDLVSRLGFSKEQSGKSLADAIYSYYKELQKEGGDKLAVRVADKFERSVGYVNRVLREKDPERRKNTRKSQQLEQVWHNSKQ